MADSIDAEVLDVSNMEGVGEGDGAKETVAE